MSEPVREEEGSKGRWVIREGEGQAEMTYSRLSPTKIIVDHTGVDDALRGRGLADRLAERAVADVRAAGETIVPLCPFLAAWARRHPEAADVFAR